MKRTDLIRKLEERAASLFATAGITTGIETPRPGHFNLVPRHREINEALAKHILKKLAN